MIMKKRNYWAICMTIFMLLAGSLAGTATAEAQNSKYDPDAKAKITIHKRAVAEDAELTYSGNGRPIDEEQIIGNGGSGALTLKDLEKLKNIGFKITQVTLKDNVQTTKPEEGNYSIVENGYSAVGYTNDQGVVSFEGDDSNKGLPHGVYLIEELKNPAISTKASDFFVSVPMLNQTGTEWIYDIHVYPKSIVEAGPQIACYVTEQDQLHETFDLNQEIKWLIISEIPEGIGGQAGNTSAASQDIVEYKITDILPNGLNYQSAKMFLTDAAGQRQELFSSEDADGPETVKVNQTQAQDKKLLTLELTREGIDKLLALAAETQMAPGSWSFQTEIYMTASALDLPEASVVDSYIDYIGKPLYNYASLEYKNLLGVSFKTESQTGNQAPEVHTGGLKIVKEDTGGRRLSGGAEFVLFDNYDDAGKYIEGENVLPLMNPWEPSQPWVVTTGENGTAYFIGLAYDQQFDESREYWLVETNAPEGYQKLNLPITVTVHSESHLDENCLVVTNAALTDIPEAGSTGGIMILSAAGLCLFGGIGMKFKAGKKK